MSAVANFPILSNEGNLSRYLLEIRRFPMLAAADEYMLAKRWVDEGDRDAAHSLVTSHLRLVAKIAMGYRGYGLPLAELISEGNVGMMQAVKKFDPERGFRLATYAIWWIKASIQEYILRSWSLVKIGTTAAQKKLFFNLRRLKGEIEAIDAGDMTAEQVHHIAETLNVTETEVIDMNRRMSGGDASLNAPIAGGEEGSGEWQDWLRDGTDNQETRLGDLQEQKHRRHMLKNALTSLNVRERDILIARRLQDNPKTLEDLSQIHGISRERVRQIEARAFEKLQGYMMTSAMGETP